MKTESRNVIGAKWHHAKKKEKWKEGSWTTTENGKTILNKQIIWLSKTHKCIQRKLNSGKVRRKISSRCSKQTEHTHKHKHMKIMKGIFVLLYLILFALVLRGFSSFSRLNIVCFVATCDYTLLIYISPLDFGQMFIVFSSQTIQTDFVKLQYWHISCNYEHNWRDLDDVSWILVTQMFHSNISNVWLAQNTSNA